jgi:hypothetical protein
MHILALCYALWYCAVRPAFIQGAGEAGMEWVLPNACKHQVPHTWQCVHALHRQQLPLLSTVRQHLLHKLVS